MIDKPNPCQACQAQVKASPEDHPHVGLEVWMTSQPHPSGRIDTLYRCRACGSSILHSADPIKPGWSFLS
jgi:hypothetical protein